MLIKINKFHLYLEDMTRKLLNIKWIVAVLILLLTASCSMDIKKSKTEILFDAIETSLVNPNDTNKTYLLDTISSYDLSSLDSEHQKAFWFNAYHLFLEDLSHHPSGYLDFDRFLRTRFTIANETLTTKELIEKINAFNDPRVLICLDFYTTTSSPTSHQILNKNSERSLDSLCSKIINDPSFIRVKSDLSTVYYPEHFDWHFDHIHSEQSSKDIILSYHKDKNLLKDHTFIPYPFSYKLRN